MLLWFSAYSLFKLSAERLLRDVRGHPWQRWVLQGSGRAGGAVLCPGQSTAGLLPGRGGVRGGGCAFINVPMLKTTTPNQTSLYFHAADPSSCQEMSIAASSALFQEFFSILFDFLFGAPVV